MLSELIILIVLLAFVSYTQYINLKLIKGIADKGINVNINPQVISYTENDDGEHADVNADEKEAREAIMGMAAAIQNIMLDNSKEDT